MRHWRAWPRRSGDGLRAARTGSRSAGHRGENSGAVRRAAGALTVLKENTATTLSHGESTLGSQPMTLDKAFATRSERRCDSATECVLPVRPQVKGLRLLAIGWRPWISLLMKSPTVMESGGSGRGSVSVSVLAVRPSTKPAHSLTKWELRDPWRRIEYHFALACVLSSSVSVVVACR